jgi:hypothetical protein
LTLKEHGSTPTLGQVSDLAKRILDQNFPEFGKLWQNEARCDLVFFGYLPNDRQLKCFHVGSNLVDNKIVTESNELHLVRDGLCASFGSCSNYFMAQLKADMGSTGNFHPFNILGQIIDSGNRSDVGGYVQVAIASKSDVVLPHVLKPRPELGEHAADVTFLGRDVSEIGGVGDCSIGKEAVGPDRTALAKILSDAKKHPS